MQIRNVSSLYIFHKANVKFTTGLAQDFPCKTIRKNHFNQFKTSLEVDQN